MIQTIVEKPFIRCSKLSETCLLLLIRFQTESSC